MPIVATNQPIPTQACITPNSGSDNFTAFLGRAVQKSASDTDAAAHASPQMKKSDSAADSTRGKAKQKAVDEKKIDSAVVSKTPDMTTVPLCMLSAPQEQATGGVGNDKTKAGATETGGIVRQAGDGTRGIGAGDEAPAGSVALSGAQATVSQSSVSESSAQLTGISQAVVAQVNVPPPLSRQSASEGPTVAGSIATDPTPESKAEPSATADASGKSSFGFNVEPSLESAALRMSVVPNLEPVVEVREKTNSKHGSTEKNDAAKPVENRNSQPEAGVAVEPGSSQKGTAGAADKTHSPETNSTEGQPNFVVPSVGHQVDGSASVLVEVRAPVTSAEISNGQGAAGSNATVGASVSGDADTAQAPSGSTVVHSANLVERIGQSELRVGIQSPELGAIDIRTRLSHHELMAEIAVQRSDLGTALSAGLSNLHARLAEQHVAVGEIVVQNQPFGSSAGMQQGTGQPPNQPQKAFVGRDLKEGPVDSSDVSYDASDQGHGLDLHI